MAKKKSDTTYAEIGRVYLKLGHNPTTGKPQLVTSVEMEDALPEVLDYARDVLAVDVEPPECHLGWWDSGYGVTELSPKEYDRLREWLAENTMLSFKPETF